LAGQKKGPAQPAPGDYFLLRLPELDELLLLERLRLLLDDELLRAEEPLELLLERLVAAGALLRLRLLELLLLAAGALERPRLLELPLETAAGLVVERLRLVLLVAAGVLLVLLVRLRSAGV
jgi:hypothetical protein